MKLNPQMPNQIQMVFSEPQEPDIRKEAFVREEVRVRKEVQQDVATAKVFMA